jgi:hypothetical protein
MVYVLDTNKKQPLSELSDFGDLTLGHSFYYRRKNTDVVVFSDTL